MASHILAIPQPLSHRSVTMMTMLSETILIEIELVPVEAELFHDMINNILLFSEGCTKKTNLFKTSIILIQEEYLLEELFMENIPAEILVKYSKTFLKEEEKIKSTLQQPQASPRKQKRNQRRQPKQKTLTQFLRFTGTLIQKRKMKKMMTR
jgi:hypothetical protein